ncbi:gamma-glutamylcyclotransferase family protein [Allomuricauda sp. F6463D]|uniref:gamma-glutamylcyclotransferase family protein n=1 Tax=Allomuricauda sp. F6463D TaxID=2926409 RepID=UPI001FF23935|nr:gamma-glutamylcyclotransferase family protein [Muricauda sp. F6463D]MCK0160904.1 gamma-glutamylcyclotransferase [Muricauda sp. F6463D]
MEYLFSYGTIQDPQVQKYVFGRLLKGKADTALGFKKVENAIYGRYPLIIKTNNARDKVNGMSFEVNDLDLKKADIYETSAYKREKFPLESGGEAWVYIKNSN